MNAKLCPSRSRVSCGDDRPFYLKSLEKNDTLNVQWMYDVTFKVGPAPLSGAMVFLNVVMYNIGAPRPPAQSNAMCVTLGFLPVCYQREDPLA